MTTGNLEKNKEYVKKEFASLLNLYRDKYILVSDEAVVGSYDSYETAAEIGINEYGIDSGFLIQYVTEKEPVNFVSIA